MRHITIARVYDNQTADDHEKADAGYRVLVDRLWPRGVRKASLDYDEWCRDIAPSTELRKWFGHDPERFDEFRERYLAELRDSAEPRALLERAEGKDITLLIGAKDSAHSQGAVLRDYLLELSAS